MNFDEIEAITSSILEEAQELLGKSELPVPVHHVVSELFQLKVEQAELPKEQAGKLILETRTILVNSKDKAERQRFTISHELGHYCLHRKNLTKSNNSTKCLNRRKETEANTFAAYLLMPRRLIYQIFIKELMNTTKENLDWLLKILNHLPDSNIFSLNPLISNYAIIEHRNVNVKQQFLTSIVPKIALSFAVSPDAVTWRLKDLKILSNFTSKEFFENI